MASKKSKLKHKPGHMRQVPADELLKQAEEFVLRGRTAEALQLLRQAEAELTPRLTAEGKRITMPPHLVAAQAAWPAAMARAQAAHAPTLSNPQKKLSALEEAVRLAPQEPRYRAVLGACRLTLGDVEAAFADFQKADELAPDAPLTARALALGLLARGRAREAGELLHQIPAEVRDENQRRLASISGWLSNGEVPDTGPLLSRPLLLGLWHLANGDPEAAREALAALPALDHNPTRGEAILIAAQFFRSGEANFLTRRHREALADWREAQRLAVAHGLPLPWTGLIAAYCHRIAEGELSENLPRAVKAWQLARALQPEDQTAAANLSLVRRAEAQQAWGAGQIEQAANLWHELLQANPQDETLLRNLSVACERLGRKAEAIEHWRALARLWRQQFKQRAAEDGFKPRLQRLERHLLDLMTEVGQSPQEMLDELEAALRFDPENHKFRLEVAQLQMELGKPQRALKHLDQILQQQGPSATLLSHKALALDLAGRTKEAGKTFEQAYALDPADKNVQFGYLHYLGREAMEAEENDDLDRAIELCRQQLRIDDDYFPAIAQLASIYFSTGRKQEAKELLHRTAQKAPPRPQRQIGIGAIFLLNGFKKEAQAAFKRAGELGADAECFFMIGAAYLENNNVKEAVQNFDRAAETADVEMLLSMATSLFDEGKNKEAERYVARAKKLDPDHPLPYFIQALSSIGNPLDLLLMSDKKRQQLLREFNEAEKRMAGRRDFDDIRQEMAEVKKMIESAPSGPGGLLNVLGGRSGALPPFLLGDDDDDFGDEPFFFDPPVGRSRSKPKKRRG